MRLVFAGTPAVAVPSLRALVASRHDVVAVITRPDAPAGRGRRPRPSAVATVAADLGLPVLKPDSAKDEDFHAALAALGPDCAAAVAYGALLPPALLALPPHGWVNLHFSLLPAWRGAAPVQHAILAGDDITGATTFAIVPALDSGPVYGVMTYPVPPRASSGEVLTALAESADALLVRTLDAIADGSAHPLPQGDDGVTLAPKLTVADARVEWSAPQAAVDRRVRACTPAPGAWTALRGERLGLGVFAELGAVAAGETAPGPGALTVTKREVWVGTGTAPVRLGRVRPAGRGWMDAADWARGARIEAGEALGGEA
jgi:methionyl-tRNA formyltransferase